jgi:hypothetical protein
MDRLSHRRQAPRGRFGGAAEIRRPRAITAAPALMAPWRRTAALDDQTLHGLEAGSGIEPLYTDLQSVA